MVGDRPAASRPNLAILVMPVSSSYTVTRVQSTRRRLLSIATARVRPGNLVRGC